MFEENIVNKIKEIYSLNDLIPGKEKTIIFTLNKYPEIKNSLTNFILEHPEYEGIVKLIRCIFNNIILPKCLNESCKNIISYKRFINGGTYCSTKCKNLDSKRWIKKTEETCLKKYGVKNPWQAEIIKDKIKDTCLKKYGSEKFQSSNFFKEKFKETCLKKYGVENPQQDRNIKDKTIKTCLKKYGIKFLINKPNVKKDAQEKTLNRGWNMIKKWSKYVIPLFSKDEYKRS